MRFIKKSVSVFLAFAILFSLSAFNASAVTGYVQKLTDMAEGINHCIIYNVTDNKLVFSKNAHEKISIASTTKIVTALVALKYADAEDVFTVGTELNLVKPNSSLCLIREGHKLKLKTLIAGMLLPSGNDAAYTVAVNIARLHAKDDEMSDSDAVSYFCNLMNEYAASLGLKDSHFNNPEGWDDPEHYSTVEDMLVFSEEALKNSTLTTIMSTFSRTFWFASGENIVWTNTNSFLNPASPYYYAFANGIKTGTTDEAGRCIVAAAKKAGVQLIILAYDCSYDNIKDDLSETAEGLSENNTQPDTGDAVLNNSTIDGSAVNQDSNFPETDYSAKSKNHEDIRFGKVREMFEFVFNAPVKGDVDESGDVNAADARFVLRASVGLEKCTETVLFRGDIDGNGKLNASDARFILRVSVGLEKLS